MCISHSLTSLPEGLRVGGDLNLSGCTGLTSLPEGLSVGGDLALDDCTGLTSLPEWVFQLQPNQTVYARNTGIPVRLLQQYNTRQNEPGYYGPRIEFSIRDYQPISNVTAEQLPQLVEAITETEAGHSFWEYAADQRAMGSLYNSFAEFLTRLLNELPAGDKRQNDLATLKETLTPLFRQMQEEYDEQNSDISKCQLINNVLAAAKMVTDSCIDKVKLGYVAMQLLARRNSENDQKTLGTIIKTVDDIGALRVIFDTKQKTFIHVAKTILNGEFDDLLKAKAKYLLKQTDDSSIALTEEETDLFEKSDASNMDKNKLTQHLVALIRRNAQENTYKEVCIGDPVEDYLSLAYALLPSDLHKINMTYASCCTLQNRKDGDQLNQAALDYINNLS